MEYHLAPLKNITCWAFRATCKGATDSYTEMVNVHQLLNLNSVKWDLIDTYHIPNQKQWVQVLAHNYSDFEKLPSKLQDFSSQNPDRNHIYGININAGCPDQNIIGAGEGAALLHNPNKIRAMIKTFLGKPESHPYAISVKMRLGLSVEDLTSNIFVEILEHIKSLDDPRIKPTVIHFKHATQKSIELPRWDLLEVALDTQNPIIINGNISSKMDIHTIKQILPHRYQKEWKTKIKGIMIGRGAIKNPDCFLQFLSKGQHISQKEWKIRLKDNLSKHLPAEKFSTTLSSHYKI
ncbi:tRNA-dihydrouridine synthase family protein [Candidatus Lokiarchaeum ossiferum]|uniref:tRNA-dihydrouridine synthase family protein n=1 Tax=Candidatus Lokiarchaeum ossiferum TaxID=2951803 RepID=UPI00352CE9A1